jgi:hypothetical protein
MERQQFETYLKQYAQQIETIRQSAHELHRSVNQTYGDGLPYGYHLDMVVQGLHDFGHLVCVREEDVLPLFFGGYYHDSIEDARLTYNDVMKTARQYLTEEQAIMATEITRRRGPAGLKGIDGLSMMVNAGVASCSLASEDCIWALIAV